jgi:hypothetical protein
MSQLLRRDAQRSFVVIQIAAGVGLLPIILHSMFDFALHMPSNAMWVATLAGVLFHPGVEDKPVQAGRVRGGMPGAVEPTPP